MVQAPSAPVHEPQTLRGDYARAGADYTVEQDWRDYSEDEHAIWAQLYGRQIELIERYAAPEFLHGVHALGASATRIPRFEAANRVLADSTGRRIAAVPALIREQISSEHRAGGRLPVTV